MMTGMGLPAKTVYSHVGSFAVATPGESRPGTCVLPGGSTPRDRGSSWKRWSCWRSIAEVTSRLTANMTDAQLSALLVGPLLFRVKRSGSSSSTITRRERSVRTLPNTYRRWPTRRRFHSKDTAYLVWGIEDGTTKVVGTKFKPHKAKQGNEELENWLMRSLHPQVNFRIHEWTHRGKPVVHSRFLRGPLPVRFGSEEFIRIGSVKKKLKDFPAKEAELWASFSKSPFEDGIAKAGVRPEVVLSLIDFSVAFDLLKITLPTNQKRYLNRLTEENLLVRKPGGCFDITNLGAVLFAKDLNRFDRIGRKALRIIKYKGSGRTETEREWRDPPSRRGYAIAFDAAVAFINSQLPQNEPIGRALRTEVRVYPETAIRGLVANALIHQDFSVTGAGPMVEIFADRMEITNPGEPLVDTLRFIDTPPRSRNEQLAALMRRMKFCEGLVKPADPTQGKKYASYLPFWA